MPVTYRIDATSRLIRTKCTGDVTFQEVKDHLRTLQQDPSCPDRADVLLDLGETTSLPEGNQVWAVSDEIKRLRERVRFGACAIIACNDALFGMMRMFEAVAQDFFRATYVFRVASEAEAWLASQQSLVEHQS